MSRRIQFTSAATAIAAVAALGQADSRPARWRQFAIDAMLAPGALAALTALIALAFGMIYAAGLGVPNVSILFLSATVVLTYLWCHRPAHPLVELRFLRGPRFVTGVVIAFRASRGVLLIQLLAAQHITAPTPASFRAFESLAKQPRSETYEHLATPTASNSRDSAPTNASRPSAQTANIAVIVGTSASLPGLPQRLSPSVA